MLFVCIGLAIATEGRFLAFANIMNILRQTPIIALMAVGMLCVILLGGIDLSAGSLLAISICCSGVVMQKFNIQNPLILILVCLVVGTLAGAFNGVLLTKLHLPHPFIATLGMKNVCRGLALLITGLLQSQVPERRYLCRCYECGQDSAFLYYDNCSLHSDAYLPDKNRPWP